MLCLLQVVAAICCHTSLLNIIDYVPYTVLFIPVTCSFHNWKAVSPTSLYPFYQSLILLPSGNYQFVFCIYRSDSAFYMFIHRVLWGVF